MQMKKVKVNGLVGGALDWAVAKCLGWITYPDNPVNRPESYTFRPSTNWAQGGPILEREKIEVKKGNPLYFPSGNEKGEHYEPLWIAGKMHGQTYLIAAMRCYVAAKMGTEVEVPADLLS